MTSPSLELQGAIVALLKDDATVDSICAGRVFDRVPRNATGAIIAPYPFVGISSHQEIYDDSECAEGAQVFITLDCWSRDVGFPEVHRLADAVRRALTRNDITLSDNALVYFRADDARITRDADGISSQAVLTFEAFIETLSP
ncbi:MAG: DUF3168 domain-containing protein [Mesorhizobium sp.]